MRFIKPLDKIELGTDVIGAVSLEQRDALLNQKIAHRRVHVLVGTPDVVSPALQERCQGGHRCTAHADEMYALHLFLRSASRRSLAAAGAYSFAT